MNMENYVIPYKDVWRIVHGMLIIQFLFYFPSCNQQEKRQTKPENTIGPVTYPSLRVVDTTSKTINDTIILKPETPRNSDKQKDTTVVMSFEDLSNVYNYKIIDKYLGHRMGHHDDSVARVIKIFDKQDSLIQRVYPKLEMTPWYFMDLGYSLRRSRSYVTGKNKDYTVFDNYCGEIVVADLNFDGLEDFATPVDHGADNGAQYAFYIQDTHHRFKLSWYLTKEVTWFPTEIVDSLMFFTTIVPCGAFGTMHHKIQYDTLSQRWKMIDHYIIDNQSGEKMKCHCNG